VTGLGEYFAQWQDCQIFLGTTYQNGKKYAKLPPNIPNGHNIYQMALNRTHFIKYTNIFHCKTLKNLPKLGFLVWKYTIWQPCSVGECLLWGNTRKVQKYRTFLATLFHGWDCALILTKKWVGLHFGWPRYSKTHLVALSGLTACYMERVRLKS
jgi:hypothetical protein